MGLKYTPVPARSTLRRIIKKLTAALTDVAKALGGRRPETVIDYESLMALSNGTSVEAIRTINNLSSRLSSSGSSSIVSRGRARSRRHHQKSGTRSEAPPSKSGKSGKLGKSGKPPNESKIRGGKSAVRQGHHSVDEYRAQSSRRRCSPNALEKRHRASILTMSSDSTKLGEIRRRGSRDAVRREYSKVTYPLCSHPPDESKGRNRWRNPFRSS